MMQTGRLPHDPARLAAVAPHQFQLAIPARLDRSHIPFVPGLYQNDILPDCTAAALADTARAAAWVWTGADIVIDPNKVRQLYARTVGVPDDIVQLAASNGAEVLDVLGTAATHGVDFGQQTLLSPTWERVDTSDVHNIAHAMLYGAAYLGADIADADMIAKVWDKPYQPPIGDETPGSKGGHCFFAWDYEGLELGDLVRFGTWGAWQPGTWRWLLDRLSDQEAYCVRWAQFGAPA